jgi:hypothetical protein
LLKEKEMVKLPRDELDFLKRASGGGDEINNMNESKKDGKLIQFIQQGLIFIFHVASILN